MLLACHAGMRDGAELAVFREPQHPDVARLVVHYFVGNDVGNFVAIGIVHWADSNHDGGSHDTS